MEVPCPLLNYPGQGFPGTLLCLIALCSNTRVYTFRSHRWTTDKRACNNNTVLFADRQDAVEHGLQVSRGVRELYDEDLLAQSAALPGRGQGADAQVPEGPRRGRGRGDGGGQRRHEPEDLLGQAVARQAEAETEVGQVGGGGRAENHRARLPGTVAQLLRPGLRDRVAGHVRPVLQPDVRG